MKLSRWLFVLAPLSAALALGGCVPPATPPPDSESLVALKQLTELKEELKKLRRLAEELEYTVQIAGSRQQTLYQDLDSRLLSLERAQRLHSLPPGGSAANGAGENASGGDVAIVDDAATATTPPVAGAAGGSVSVQEQQAYDQALKLLRQSKYQDAIGRFQRLADQWPDSQLADDAYYWMSQARYVNREFEAALRGFRTVVTRYPDSQRVPEALLHTGVIQYDIGAYREAAKIFRDVLARFPTHPVAVLAENRLRRIEQTIEESGE